MFLSSRFSLAIGYFPPWVTFQENEKVCQVMYSLCYLRLPHKKCTAGSSTHLQLLQMLFQLMKLTLKLALCGQILL